MRGIQYYFTNFHQLHFVIKIHEFKKLLFFLKKHFSLNLKDEKKNTHTNDCVTSNVRQWTHRPMHSAKCINVVSVKNLLMGNTQNTMIIDNLCARTAYIGANFYTLPYFHFTSQPSVLACCYRSPQHDHLQQSHRSVVVFFLSLSPYSHSKQRNPFAMQLHWPP